MTVCYYCFGMMNKNGYDIKQLLQEIISNRFDKKEKTTRIFIEIFSFEFR
jgi:hypothetical protein